MNWLAHTLLSKNNIEYQLGNVLADPLRGAAWKGASQSLIEGMKMHKAIDKFTDKHPVLTLSKSKLGSKGHLKGVVLDLLYDHFLSQNWQAYCRYDLTDFLLVFNRKAFVSSRDYPDKAKRIVSRMAETNLLGNYQTFNGLIIALERIDQRLSARTHARETATQYLPVLEQHYDDLKADFTAFFPELVVYFKNHQLGSANNHCLL
ncbi:ACP phosphodiesterase [Marinicella litoralis]|uniref:Acyl carrier protein phosphodiesterase n=1 Tax=Marinicella litoralis TaxID=644220 RepID=A0A4R6XMV8_9GAMM|nr:ACP phosphodiesterase [Marinicella litoralis]TDR19450.1 acyl carrier protein phosphodiesterase [Marinicella litoralis]